MRDRIVSFISHTILRIILFMFTIMAIYPIIWLFIQSFKTNQDYMRNSKLAMPTNWFLGNYDFVWVQTGFDTYFINSVIYTTITVVVVVILANMAGFAFAKLKFKITKLLHGLFIIGILLTMQSILVPLFLMMSSAGLLGTRWAILIPYVALGLPMAVYLCTDFIRNIPDELLESGRIDGAGYLRIFRSIVLPMCAPVSVTISIVTFTSTWNEFMLMNLMASKSGHLKAIPAGVAAYTSSLGSDYGKLFTALTISVIPILIFYIIFRNQITKGVAAGAVKG